MTGLHLLHPLQFPSSELHDDHVQRGALAQGLHTVLCVFTCQPRWLCRHSESYLKMSILCSGGKFEVSLLRRQNVLAVSHAIIPSRINTFVFKHVSVLAGMDQDGSWRCVDMDVGASRSPSISPPFHIHKMIE